MSLPKIILTGGVIILGSIGIAAFFKKSKEPQKEALSSIHLPVSRPISLEKGFPQVDHVNQFFTTSQKKFPIVETVEYKSHVSWLKGRPAWIADYAAYYGTSRHFIARSLNGTLDYYTQKVGEGQKFNVFRKESRVEFLLLVDLSLCKMAFYYLDLDKGERVLVKTYDVSIGKEDKNSLSLTPIGSFNLGGKIAVYKPGIEGFFQDKKVEMIRIFGTRWLPLEGVGARGLGIHGVPFVVDPKTGDYSEVVTTLGKKESDGCIRMRQLDIEELFSIVITKPTRVEIVRNFQEAKLPGVER